MVRDSRDNLAHRYGVDRSWFFNLGIKINEATGATILWPDLRGQGLNPSVSWTSFGSIEGDDIQAALDYLRTLKSVDGQTLVGDKVALYGVEMGGYAALGGGARCRNRNTRFGFAAARSGRGVLSRGAGRFRDRQ